MKTAGFIVLLILGSLALQAQSDPIIDPQECRISLELEKNSVATMVKSYVGLKRENDALKAERAKLIEENAKLKDVQGKASN